MTRLIDADAMRQDWLENGENEYVYDTNAVLDSIDEQPTVDAVPVVLCKDCKHYNEDNMSPHSGWCECLERGEYNEHFCCYGERRSGDEGNI